MGIQRTNRIRYSEVYSRSKRNAQKRNIEFNLTPKEFWELVADSAGICTVSGIQFSAKYLGFGRRKPFAPSLDRIDGSKGYSKNNCRLVCIIVNIAMNEWGEEPLIALCRALYQKEQAAKAEQYPPIIEIDKSFATAKEFLTQIKETMQWATSLSLRAARMCREGNLPIKVKSVPVYQRADFSWYYQPQNSYPKSVLKKCWKRIEAC